MSTTTNIRILIADDHPVVREGLQGLLSLKPDFEVIGTAEDGEEAVLQANLLKPDVILMDLEMPRKNGLEAIKEIKANQPEIKILVLTSFTEDKKIFAALDAGALGCLLKDSSPQELIRAIRDVHQGQLTLHPTVARKMLHEKEKPESPDSLLTDREIEVLQLVAQGLDNHEIADTLIVALPTVRSHVSNILNKLGLSNRTQAVLYALRHNIASLDNSD